MTTDEAATSGEESGVAVSIMLATPTVDSRLGIGYVRSTFETAVALNQRGISWTPFYMGGCSDIVIARCDILAQFMASGLSHILMIDSDMGWRPQDVLRLLDHDEPFICGAYPRRMEPGNFALRWRSGENAETAKVDERGLIEVDGVGTGFMLVRRDAVEQMQAAFPDLIYRRGGDVRYALFHHEVADGEMYGEDYSFCHRWRASGGRVLVDPFLRLQHYQGSAHVEGCLADLIPSLRNRTGEK